MWQKHANWKAEKLAHLHTNLYQSLLLGTPAPLEISSVREIVAAAVVLQSSPQSCHQGLQQPLQSPLRHLQTLWYL